MTKPQWSRLITAGGAALVVVALTLGLLPSTASAADVTYTAQASGRALQLAIGGVGVGDDQLAARTADTDRLTTDGTNVPDCVEATSPNECREGPGLGTYPNIPLLANILSVGVLAQDAAVDDVGNSKACAGVVGPGGLLTIDETPEPCLGADPSNPGGIMVNLVNGLPLGLLRLRVDGIYAECSATAGNPAVDPAVPASATGVGRVANVVIDTLVPILGWQPLLTLPVGGAPNSSVLFPTDSVFAPLNALVSVIVNEQTPAPPASGPDTRTRVDVTALHVTLLGAVPGGLVDVKAGQVSCGTNTAALDAGPTTSTTADPGSTTTTDGSTSTTADPGSTTTTADPGSTTTTDPGATTSTTEDPNTTSTTEDPDTTSTTEDPDTTSTTEDPGAASSTTADPSSTSTTKAALAKSGVNTRTQVSIALGLLGLGMLVTGRGMQLGFDGPGRRRR